MSIGKIEGVPSPGEEDPLKKAAGAKGQKTTKIVSERLQELNLPKGEISRKAIALQIPKEKVPELVNRYEALSEDRKTELLTKAMQRPSFPKLLKRVINNLPIEKMSHILREMQTIDEITDEAAHLNIPKEKIEGLLEQYDLLSSDKKEDLEKEVKASPDFPQKGNPFLLEVKKAAAYMATRTISPNTVVHQGSDDEGEKKVPSIRTKAPADISSQQVDDVVFVDKPPFSPITESSGDTFLQEVGNAEDTPSEVDEEEYLEGIKEEEDIHKKNTVMLEAAANGIQKNLETTPITPKEEESWLNLTTVTIGAVAALSIVAFAMTRKRAA